MAGMDPELQAANSFTDGQHGPKIPDNLKLADHHLPKDFTLLILGAGEGIGEHIAYQYVSAMESGTIIICARRLSNLEHVRSEILKIKSTDSIRVEIKSCDISSSESMQQCAEFVKDKVGRLDCLIVNAAYVPPVLLRTHLDQPADIQRAFDTNCVGTFHAGHYFVPLLLDTPHGAKQFIAVGSMAGLIRRGHIANMGYCVSKMAQTRMVEYLHEQYAAPENGGLWCVTVHPGAVLTSLAQNNTPDSFRPYLVDNVGLCGAFCTHLSKRSVAGELDWLSGRFISANWDVAELLARKDAISEKDLLKFVLSTG